MSTPEELAIEEVVKKYYQEYKPHRDKFLVSLIANAIRKWDEQQREKSEPKKRRRR